MRTVFMGSPGFAVPSLNVLSEISEIVGVVTQPDRRSGRGRKLTISAVKQRALELDLPTLQPDRLREPDPVETLREWAPDIIVVAAFGQILSREVLEIPPLGSVNVHASLLPRWRGAAPIQAAIYHGDLVTGVTLMLMDEGLDTGPILAQLELAIGENQTAGDLSQDLANLGAELLEHTLPEIVNDKIQPTVQDDQLATFAPRLRKSDGWLDFSRTAFELCLQVRAYHPWPGSFFNWKDRRIRVLQAAAVDGRSEALGNVIRHERSPAVATSDGLFLLLEIHPAGGKSMEGAAFLQGYPDFIGANLLTDKHF